MKKSNLILSFFVGAIALSVATLSMSVAWYAASDTARVETIIMTIDGDRELLISTEPDGHYVQKLDNSDLMDPGAFTPLTAAYSSTWLNITDAPVFYDETRYDINKDVDLLRVATSGYFSQKLYLLADDDLYITIDPTNTFIAPNSNNKNYAAILYENYQKNGTAAQKALSKDDIEERLNKLVNAMRYSLLIKDLDTNLYDYYIIDPNKNQETIYGGLLDNNCDQYYDYYVDNGVNYERVYGELTGNKDNIVYDLASSEDSGYKHADEEPSAFNAKHKEGVRTFNYEASREKGIDFKKEESIEVSEFLNANKPIVFPVYRDTPREITLSIYIEGWDLDSINYTMGSTFNANLSFTIEREM